MSSVLASVFSLSLVSAAGKDVINGLDNFATELLAPLVGTILGGGTEFWVARLLFFLIVLGIVWVALSRIGFFVEYTWVLVVVSAAVSILSVRYIIDDNLIDTIILPYSVLGVVLTAGIPFVLYFFVVNIGMKDQPSAIRKVAWIFFAVVFIFLWFSRYDTLADKSPYSGWIYPVTAILAFVMIFLDGTWRRFWVRAELERSSMSTANEAELELKRRIATIQKDITDGIIPIAQGNKLIGDYKKRLIALHKS